MLISVNSLNLHSNIEFNFQMSDNPSHPRTFCLVDAFSLCIGMYYVQIFARWRPIWGCETMGKKIKDNLKNNYFTRVMPVYFNYKKTSLQYSFILVLV